MAEDKKQANEEKITKSGAVELEEEQLKDVSGGSLQPAIKFVEPAIKFSPITQPAIKFAGP